MNCDYLGGILASCFKSSRVCDQTAAILASVLSLDNFVSEEWFCPVCQAEEEGRPPEPLFRHSFGQHRIADSGDAYSAAATLLGMPASPSGLRTNITHWISDFILVLADKIIRLHNNIFCCASSEIAFSNFQL